MARTPISKILYQTRLANTYGGWMYCEHCGSSIGYLCYVTYDSFMFHYHCKCGGEGDIQIAFKDTSSARPTSKPLLTIKNRLCCSNDESPLFTVLEKNLISYKYEIVCNKCDTKFMEDKTL